MERFATIKDIRNLYSKERENNGIKDRILIDTKNLFKYEEEENYYKPARVIKFWSNNHIEYESNGERNKTLSVEEYLNKIKQYLKNILNNLKKSDTWKIQLTIANNFIFSIDNDEEHEVNSNKDNIEMMVTNEADEVVKERFNSIKNRYHFSLEPIKGSEIVYLFYYKINEKNPNGGGLYIDSSD